MINAAAFDPTGLFGLFELDDTGKVLYSRSHQPERRDSDATSAVGMDFFSEVANFENSGDLRDRFRRFLASRSPADNFCFDCLFGDRSVRTRISMIRGHEADAQRSAGIVIMDIRRDAK